MTPLRLIASAVALCGASAIVAAWGGPKADDAKSDADTFAHAAHVAPLRERGADELRIWAIGAVPITDGGGIVVKASGVMHCKVPHDVFEPGHKALSDAPCESADNPGRARRLLEFLPLLAREKLKECQTLDGDEWVIDGVLNGHRFTHLSYNPQVCNDVLKDISAITDNNGWRAP
jgi:hypothetical protein